MADFPYDDELITGGSIPSANDLEAQINKNLSSWLSYLDEDPSLHDLNAKAQQIMADLGYATAMPATIEKAIELALAVDLQFERLGLWRSWYPRLMELYSPTMDRLPEEGKANFYRAFVSYYLYRGDLKRANAAVEAILELAAEKWNEALQDAMIGAAAIATGLEIGDRGEKLARMLVSLAYVTGNDMLLGRSYCVLTQFYADRFDPKRTFVYGQMVYCVGLKLGHETFILNGLHYMALAFQVAQDYRRAIGYIDRAMAYARSTGDKVKIDYMMLTLGMCHYGLGAYEKAEEELGKSITTLSDAGNYYASALYAHGLCLLALERFEAAKIQLTAALTEWEKLQYPFDVILAKHALSELYSLTGQHGKAILLSMIALTEAEKMPERAGEFYLNTLRNDVLEYRRRRVAFEISD